MILVLASDFNDLKENLSGFIRIGKEKANETTVYMTCINNQPLLFADSGETKVNFTRNFMNIKNVYPVTSVIGIGNLASFHSIKEHIGDIAIPTYSLQYDVDFSVLGEVKGKIPDLNKKLFYSSVQLINAAKTSAEKHGFRCSCKTAASADRFCADTSEAKSIKKRFDADYTDTECGVLGELAYIYGIPSVSVKGISNFANDSAVADYNEYKEEANAHSLKVALEMIEHLTK